MNKKLAKKARSALWDSATGWLRVETQSIESGDYDADKQAAVEGAKARLKKIKKLLGEPHSVSGLTNKKASVLAREERQLEVLIEQYERSS
jgi:hypothetical protein